MWSNDIFICAIIVQYTFYIYKFHSLNFNDIFPYIVVIQDKFKNIRVCFCTKDTSIGDESDWPAGNYCILKYGICPVGKY